MIATAAAPRMVPAVAADAPTTLIAGTRTIEVRGKSAKVFGIQQPNGTAGLTTDIGRPFRARLENRSGEPTLIHWHGLKPPYRQDGVPDVSAPLIPPGDGVDYDFPLDFPGTFWMHSHQGLQEQRLMAAPLIIRDDGDADRQEIVIMLHDFTFRSPDEVLAGLRKEASMGSMALSPSMPSSQGTHTMPMAGTGSHRPGMTHDPMSRGHGAASHGAGMSGMAMDLNDVAYDAFLANDRTLGDPEVVRVEPGDRILLRIINGAAASNFVIDLGRLKGKLIAVDGHAIDPIMGSRFPVATAQRLDLRLELPKERSTHPVLAVLEGEAKRTGIVLAPTGAPIVRLGDRAEKPTAPLNLSFEQGLRAAAPLSPKSADRVHDLDLTGSMSGYDWGLNGARYPHTDVLAVARGERVEIAMSNKTMMSHPMHLHGHFFQVVAVDDKRFAGAVRDTVLVPPMQTVTIAFDADNPGEWAFHCHNLYHMAAGMMTTLRYIPA
jgi:FtsP/CotA-like multicopper oxidase with cupredoxin domain